MTKFQFWQWIKSVLHLFAIRNWLHLFANRHWFWLEFIMVLIVFVEGGGIWPISLYFSNQISKYVDRDWSIFQQFTSVLQMIILNTVTKFDRESIYNVLHLFAIRNWLNAFICNSHWLVLIGIHYDLEISQPGNQ